MTNPGKNVWDQSFPTADSNTAAATKLSQMVAGTKNLMDQPGLVAALGQAGADPMQAKLIDQFLGGLNTEVAVRNAARTGQKIWLSADQTTMLDAMGVDYSGVQQSVQGAKADVISRLKAQGMQPVYDAQGNIKTDAKGNVLGQKIPQHQDSGWFDSFGSFFHNLTNNPVSHFLTHGTFDESLSSMVPGSASDPKFDDAMGLLNEGYQYINTSVSENFQKDVNPDAYLASQAQNADLATRLGYDPNSVFSMLAFKAAGYAHTDTSHLADGWDAQNPNLNGWDGNRAVLEAEAYAADPGKYMANVVGNRALTTDQRAAQVQFLSSDTFQNLVKRVNAQKSDIGSDFARSIGLDPVHEASRFNLLAGTTNTAATFALDPLNFGLTAFNATRRASVTVKNLVDAGDINRIFRPDAMAGVTSEQAKQITWLRQMVTHGVAFREAMDAGDHVYAVTIKGALKGNPYAELLPDFSGFDQILAKGHTFGDIADNGAALKLDPIRNALGGLMGAMREGHGAVEEARKFSDELDDLEARLQLGMGDKTAHPDELAALHDTIADGRSLLAEAQRGATPAAEEIAKFESQLKDVESTFNAGPSMRAATFGKDYTNVAKAKDAVEGTSPYKAAGPQLMKDQDVLERKATEVPFITGKAEPIRTYDEAVDYLASRGALLRLSGGRSMVESGLLPGALSSYGYRTLRGRLASWQVAKSAIRTESANEKWVLGLSEAAKQKALDDGWLIKAMPTEDDAYDLLNGKRIAGTDVALTDVGRGELQSNRRIFGRTSAPETLGGKIISAAVLGSVSRWGYIAKRLTNWLPAHTNIDVTTDASVDTVEKIARTFMNNGDAAMITSRYIAGDADTRKTIYQGLWEQVMHAAGLARTDAGRKMLAERQWDEHYSNLGDDLLDNNGRAMGLVPGHIQTQFSLPNFGKIHQASAKVGLWEATMGRLLTNEWTDRLMGFWKIGVLSKATTFTRATIESWLGAYAEKEFGHAAAVKAFLRENNMLVGAAGRTRVTENLAKLAGLRQASRWYTHVMAQRVPEDEAHALLTMPEDLFQGVLEEQTNHHFATSVDIGGAGEATELANNGFVPLKMRLKDGVGAKRTGFELTDDMDAANGADTYANVLRTWVNDDPNLARTVLGKFNKLREGEGYQATKGAYDDKLAQYEQDVKDWRKAKSAATRKGIEFDTPKPELPDASLAPKVQTDIADVSDIVAALDKSEAMRHSNYGSYFWDESGSTWTKMRATTPAEVALGKEQWARKILTEMEYLVSGRNGVVQEKLVDHILEHGKAPDADWILNNVKGINRPQALLRPTFMPMSPKGSIADKVDGILDVAGKGYKYIVERPIQRNVTAPMFGAAYAKSKVALESWKQSLVDGGLSEAAAEKVARDMAVHQAWNRIARLVDDPHMKSQMDVVGRSFFAFSRATTMMIRRWSGIAWRNPEQARRLMLAWEAANHSGITYTDQNGDRMFYIPGSGVAQEVLFHAASKIPGLEGLAMFPAQDLLGRTNTIIPGSDGPFQYGMNPLVAIPMREVAGLFPQHREWFDEVDRALNGSLGQGSGVIATLEPSLVKAFTDPASNDRDSMTTSAMVGSLYDLYATGQVPKDGAAPSEIDDFLKKLEVNAKSRLYVRAVLSTFSPAVLQLDNTWRPQDAAFAQSSVRSLRDEFIQIVNDVNGDYGQAVQLWSALHPYETVYTQSGSHGLDKRAVLPATQASYNWLTQHEDFISKYHTVAGYFIPPQQTGQAYSQDAYRAQLEEGLRQRRTPGDFLNAVRIASAASPYYAMEKQYQSDYAAAKAAGDTQLASQHRADWLAWSKKFLAHHPTFQASLVASPENVVAAKGQLADLERMVRENEVPGDDLMKQAVSGMVASYNDYVNFVRQWPGGTTEAKANRAVALGQLQDYMTATIQAVPGVADLYNGVFRVLNHNLEQANASA